MDNSNNDYTIIGLAGIFATHADIAEKTRQERIKEYIEVYGESELPEHLKNYFNLSQALSFMCMEISKLKHCN